MAQETNCLTTGARFSTKITSSRGLIELEIDGLPRGFAQSEEEAIQLERNLHNAIELALAPMFVREELLKRINRYEPI
jgi:hypothetical protein